MNRGYTREQYLELAHYARKVMPGLSMTSDVIVGFPGEIRYFVATVAARSSGDEFMAIAVERGER